jgi:GT2 family glycosyltransferase
VSRTPTFSIVTPVADPPEEFLRSCARSVLQQEERDFEWIVVDDGSAPATAAVLADLATADPRVRLLSLDERRGIVAATNAGVEAAKGTFVAFLDHDDRLLPGALRTVRAVLDDTVDLVYSDEWVTDAGGVLLDPVRKPGYSPERLRSHNYVNHLVVARLSLVREVGCLRPGFDGAQDHDLVLRLVERARVALHLPEVLYQWRTAPGSVLTGGLESKAGAWEAGRRAVAEHLQRVGIDAEVEELRIQDVARWYRVRRRVPDGATVALVLPVTSCGPPALEAARQSLAEALADPGHRPDEVVVVGDSEVGGEALASVAQAARDRGFAPEVLSLTRPATIFELCNHGVAASVGEYLAFLDDGCRQPSAGWLAELLGICAEDGVGAVGGRIVTPDGALESSGYALVGGVPELFLRGLPRETTALAGMALVPGERSALPLSGMVVRRDVFTYVGGFASAIGERFADVDLCLKLRALERRNIVTPLVEFSRSDPPAPYDLEASGLEELRRRWWPALNSDPYINPAARSAPWLTTRP